MRSLIICAALMFAVFASDAGMTAQAETWPWCAAYNNGSTNCGFATHAQCMATVSGAGGFCNENPFTGATTAKSARVQRERPAQNQKVVSEGPPVSIGLSIGIGGGSSGGHHGGSKPPPKQLLTNPSNTLPPGFN
jgi:hypothetical protein